MTFKCILILLLHTQKFSILKLKYVHKTIFKRQPFLSKSFPKTCKVSQKFKWKPPIFIQCLASGTDSSNEEASIKMASKYFYRWNNIRLLNKVQTYVLLSWTIFLEIYVNIYRQKKMLGWWSKDIKGGDVWMFVYFN